MYAIRSYYGSRRACPTTGASSTPVWSTEEALQLFELPRVLGTTPEGEEVSANIGRFGPYVKYDNKYVSIRSEDPHTITLERALELIQAKKEADANREIKIFPGSSVQILNGRYGPYITDGKKNARIPIV